MQRAVEDRVVEQAVAGPGQALERAALEEDSGGAGAHLVRARAHGEGRGHGAAAARAAEHDRSDPGFDEGLVDADMGGAERARRRQATKPRRVAADEAGEPVVIGVGAGHHMVVDGDGLRVEPARGAGEGRASVMQQHEPAGLDGVDVEGKALKRAQGPGGGAS